jgi:hypothetical protein
LLRQLLIERRQGLFRLRECRLLECHICLCDLTQFLLNAQQAEKVGFDGYDLFCGGDLFPQRGLLDGPCHHIRGKRQIGGLDGILLHRGQRLVRFHLAADEPKDVRRVGDIDLSGVQGEIGSEGVR